MSRLIKIVLPSVILAGSLMLSSQFSFAKPDYMKREQKACTYCHVQPNKNGLNEVGKCYAKHGHSLENCNPKKIAEAGD